MQERFAGWPGWLQARLVPDGAFAAAYDAVTARERGHLKQAIARLAAVFPAPGAAEETRADIYRQGFRRYARSCPADWAVLFCSASCPSPARLLAALVPALAAGVPQVAVCRVAEDAETREWPAMILTALELAGVETVVSLPPGDATLLARQLAEPGSCGRAVLMGDAGLEPLPGIFRGANVPLEHLPDAVTIGIDSDGLPPEWGAPDYGLLRRMQPDAAFAAAVRGTGGLDAVFCPREAVAAWTVHCRLVLSPGHEAIWIWPGVTTAFFIEEHAGFAPLS